MIWPMAFPLLNCVDCHQPVPWPEAFPVDVTWFRPAVVHGSCRLPLDVSEDESGRVSEGTT